MTAPGRPGSALVIGEALVDVVIHPGQEPVDIPGGSPANVALGLARLGRDAELHCWIGTDERGQAVRSHLEASGVRLAPGADGATRTSTAQATIGEDRAATYVFDLDWNPPRPALDDRQAPLLVHTGSIAAILAPGAATVEQVLRETRATSTIAYDPNARPQLMGEPAGARAIVERLVAGKIEDASVLGPNLDWQTSFEEIAHARGMEGSLHFEVSSTGPDHMRVFTAVASMGGRVWGRGTGTSKKTSRQAAAEAAYRVISAEPDERGEAVRDAPLP